jgi:hypothetical protein
MSIKWGPITMPKICIPKPHDVRLLNLRNNAGSVEHYYHFLLGYLVPLCAYAGKRDNESSILLARACGPLNHLVSEIGIPGLLLCEPQSHSRLSRKANDFGFQNIEILGLDGWRKYDAERIASVTAQATQYIQQRLGHQIESLCEELESNWKPSPRLMVIRREDPDPYYLSELAEIKGAGTTRRSIANMPELIAALKTRFEQTKVVSLERRGLAEQISLFRMADVVVAQHGAALSNVIWMRPKTNVFEFVQNAAKHFHFQNLSPIFGIRHHILIQEDKKGPVDVEVLMDAIEANLT